MGSKKLKNFFLILMVILVIIGIPYLLYTLGSLIEIDYFGYVNNWWVVLLFIILLLAIFILGGIDLDKKMGTFFLILFLVSFSILGIRIGSEPRMDMESYALLMDKEQEIEQLDSVLLSLEKELVEFENKDLSHLVAQNPNAGNHEMIFFRAGSSALSYYNKDRIKAFISPLENCVLNIHGYTDDSGDSSSNLNISQKRAQNVADFILSIDQERNTIHAVTGFGAGHQLVEHGGEVAQSKNRRVTIEIVGNMDARTEKDRRKVKDDLNKTRAALEKVKEEKDSLWSIVFQGMEE